MKGPRKPKPWGQAAYFLWRRRSFTWCEIADLLNLEGWNLSPEDVSCEVLHRVGLELQGGIGSRSADTPRKLTP